VQIFYEAAGRPHGLLFSLDAAGVLTRHLPDSGNTSVPLKQGGRVPLGFAYELDDSPGWERFYFITSDKPFGLESLPIPVFGWPLPPPPADSLSLPKGLQQNVFTLLKEIKT
jgi:hypothetical protein